MCLYLFSPGRFLQIDYTAESIFLDKGAQIILIDVLLTNHSKDSVNRVHLVNPHDIPIDKKNRKDSKASFTDLTHTWLDPYSPHNQFYMGEENRLEIIPENGSHQVKVILPDPTDMASDISYQGSIRGIQELRPYEQDDDQGLTDIQWDILSGLGWSVFTIFFHSPLLENEARWIRLQIRTDVLPRNKMHPLEHWCKKLTGQLFHVFEIAGPIDVKYRLVSALKAANLMRTQSKEYRFSMLQLHDLHMKLLTYGLLADDTDTSIQDWRIHIFMGYYRKVDEPVRWHDIVPCGGVINLVKKSDGTYERCLQWKAGKRNVPHQGNGGFFGARIQVYDIPVWVSFLPWIALFVALMSFFRGFFWPLFCI